MTLVAIIFEDREIAETYAEVCRIAGCNYSIIDNADDVHKRLNDIPHHAAIISDVMPDLDIFEHLELYPEIINFVFTLRDDKDYHHDLKLMGTRRVLLPTRQDIAALIGELLGL